MLRQYLGTHKISFGKDKEAEENEKALPDRKAIQIYLQGLKSQRPGGSGVDEEEEAEEEEEKEEEKDKVSRKVKLVLSTIPQKNLVHNEPAEFPDDEEFESPAPVMCSRIALFISW